MQGNLVRTQLIIRFLDLPKERSAYGTAKTMFVLYEKAAASLRLGMHRNNKKWEEKKAYCRIRVADAGGPAAAAAGASR